MQKSKRITSYILIDALSAIIFIYLFYSDFNFTPFYSFSSLFANLSFLLILYALSGTYDQITRKSRFKEFIRTLNQSIIIIGVYAILDNYLNFVKVKDFYAFLELGLYHLAVTYIFRLIFLTFIKRKVQLGEIGYQTIIIGNNKKALHIYEEITAQKKSLGFKFTGFVEIDRKNENYRFLTIKNLGDFSNIHAIIKDHKIEEVIVAIESHQHNQLKSILDELEKTGVIINIIPDVYDIVSGFVKLNYLFSVPLITLHPDNMPFWQRMIKRIGDYVLAILVLLLFSPVFLIIIILIKTGSKGPVIYKQERIGKNGIPFNILKFRTMYIGSEKNGPALSKINDSRVTPVGRILRKTRLDELPQFINIIKGEMSLVGPRPERQFYIDQIIKEAPHYHYLHKVLPGLTSWGQVKFGYAENVEQMVKRLTFDILYVENRSLALDFKIIIYTVVTVLQGRGK